MQVADRVGVPGAARALVQAHGPAARPVARLADHLRGAADLVLGQPRELGHPGRRVVGEEGRHRLPALGVGLDERRVGVAVLVQQVQQPVEQREIGAGPDLQEQRGLVGGGGAARIDHDQLRAGLHAVHHAQEQDRMTVGHVRADHEEQVRVVEVLVRAGRPVGAERELVAAARARHAEARVRFDVGGAQIALGELVDEILRLDRHLARHVERHGVGAVRVANRGQPPRRLADRVVHRQRHRIAVARLAQVGAFEPPGVAQRDVRGRALGAEPAEVGRMLGVARDLDHLAVIDVQHHPAADAAIRAHRFHARVRHCRSVAINRRAAAASRAARPHLSRP